MKYPHGLKLEVRHLKLVQAISEEGTVTAAGLRLHLTQSALSHQLKGVEDRLGTSLFQRLGKKMVLTPAGDRLLLSARLVLGEMARTEEEITRLAGRTEGVLRLATQCYTGYHWLPPLLREFQASRPGVAVRIVVEATAGPIEALLEGAIDLAICNSKVTDRRLLARRLFEDEFLVIVAPGHALASRSYVRPCDFAGENLLTYSRFEDSRLYQKLLVPAGIRPRSVSQVQLTEAMLEMVKAELGIAVLARWAVGPHLDSGSIRGLPLTRNGFPQVWSAVTRRNGETPAYLREFVDRLAQYCPTLWTGGHPYPSRLRRRD